MAAYTKTAWVDGGAPAISAANLGKIESALANSVGLDTLADLRALAVPTSVFSARILGHSAGGDGGGGLFWWDSTSSEADNGGTIITPDSAPASGRWKRQYSMHVDPRWWGAIAGNSIDNTPKIQAALDANVGAVMVYKGAADYRIDGTVIIPPGQSLIMERGVVLHRYAANTANTTPLAVVKGSFTTLVGGELRTENNHPDGIVVLGHENTSATYDALYWKLANCRLYGVQTTGNVSAMILSSQDTTGRANYFGSIEDVEIFQTSVGIVALEYTNAHQHKNVQFWRCKVAAYQFRGAYGHTVLGGFVHTSTDGVIGIQLRNRTFGPHDSDGNTFYGVGIEPGGASSKAVVIESDCANNTIQVLGNVAGGNTISNNNNNVNTAFATVYSNRLRLQRWGDSHEKSKITRHNIGTVAENASQNIFSVSPTTRTGYFVKITVVARNTSLDRVTVIQKSYAIHNIGGTATATEISSSSGGTASVAATLSASSSSATTTFALAGANNGTATTYDYSWEASVSDSSGDISESAITTLD